MKRLSPSSSNLSCLDGGSVVALLVASSARDDGAPASAAGSSRAGRALSPDLPVSANPPTAAPSHAAATAPPSRNERGPPVGLLLMVPPSPHTCKPPQPSTDQRSRVCVTVTARSRLFRYGISLNIFHCLTTCVLRSLRSRPCSLPRKAVPTATSASTARIYRNRPRR